MPLATPLTEEEKRKFPSKERREVQVEDTLTPLTVLLKLLIPCTNASVVAFKGSVPFFSYEGHNLLCRNQNIHFTKRWGVSKVIPIKLA